MSAIGGVFHRGGRPIDPGTLDAMMAAVPFGGPDGTGRWHDGPIGLWHQLLRTVPEAPGTHHPFSERTTGLTITFDGRVDNRLELLDTLGLGDRQPDSLGDAEIVLHLYARWGEDCAARILGDFAFAIWDAHQHSVYCARDVLGVRPLYYTLDPATFAWGSHLCQLLATGLIEPEPNEGMIAEFLGDQLQNVEETFYRGLLRLPPASWLRVDRERVVKTRYWTPGPRAELRYRTDGEYADHFFEVFKEAVACRLRSNRPAVAVYLSGGVDSSSVVAMTQLLAREGRGRDVEALSLVFPDEPRNDERPYIDDVVRLWGLTSHQLEARHSDGDWYRVDMTRWKDVPAFPGGYLGSKLQGCVRDRGLSVALTGNGGDHGFTGSLYHYTDMLRDRRFVAALRQYWQDSHLPDAGWAPSKLFLMGMVPLLPSAVKDAVRPLARRLGWPGGLPQWIPQDFARRVHLEERGRVPRVDAATHSERHIRLQFAAAWNPLAFEVSARAGAEGGIDERHPFFDRRVIEFALAIPESQRWRGSSTKFVIRRAMGEWLPESVRTRTTKGDLTPYFPGALDALGGAKLLDRLHIASLGWVDQARVSWMYRDMMNRFRNHDGGYAVHTLPLWMIAGVELWFRAVFLSPPLLSSASPAA